MEDKKQNAGTLEFDLHKLYLVKSLCMRVRYVGSKFLDVNRFLLCFSMRLHDFVMLCAQSPVEIEFNSYLGHTGM